MSRRLCASYHETLGKEELLRREDEPSRRTGLLKQSPYLIANQNSLTWNVSLGAALINNVR